MGAINSVLSKTWNPKTDMPDLRGRIALVTGGNTGIGYSMIKYLALAGAKVYMATRTESKAQQAIENLYREYPSLEEGQIIFLKLDLASITSVLIAAAEFTKRERRLDILINNGAMAPPEGLSTTDAGFETTIAVCHIAHAVLLDRLLPLLKVAASEPDSDVRVVTISSNAPGVMLPRDYVFDFTSPTAFTEPGISQPRHWPLAPWLVRYCIAKGANMVFASELQRRLDADGTNIVSVSVHPGGVATQSSATVFWKFLVPIIHRAMLSPDDGAITGLFGATAAEVKERKELFKGKYLVPYGKVGSMPLGLRNSQVGVDLWEKTTEEVNMYLVRNGLDLLSM